MPFTRRGEPILPISRREEAGYLLGWIPGMVAIGGRSTGHSGGPVPPPPENRMQAMMSAIEMMKERAARIRDAGGIAPLGYDSPVTCRWFDKVDGEWKLVEKDLEKDPCRRRLQEDFKLSLRQIVEDHKALIRGQKPRLLVTDDLIPTYTLDRLKARDFEEMLENQRDRDLRILREMKFGRLSDREIIELSRETATDPAAQMVLQSIIDRLIPEEELDRLASSGEIAQEPTEMEEAPRTRFLPGGQVIEDVRLPGGPENVWSAEDLKKRDARIFRRFIESAPEYYRLNTSQEFEEMARAFNYYFWRKVYPTVRINPYDNPHLEPIVLRHPWIAADKGAPPIVNVEVTPREKPEPDPGWFAEAAPWISAVANFIPVVGQVIAVGVQVANAAHLKSWAQDIEIPTSAFEPQFDPRPFLVPLPLDRAQIAVEKPWFIPAMVEQFRQEIRAAKILNLNQALTQLQEYGEGAEGDLHSLPGSFPGARSGGDSIFAPGGQVDFGQLFSSDSQRSTAKASKNSIVIAGAAGVLALLLLQRK